MISEPERGGLLRELRNYLLFMKDVGYREIPIERELDFCKSDKALGTLDSSTAQANNSEHGEIKIGTQQLAGVRDELGDCTRCKLSEGRKTIVFGSGNPDADLVFVGEGPGADEDEQGLPFVGRAGKKLTEIIEKGMGLSRAKDAYICNIVKCRPPGNRDPEADEIEACKPFFAQTT